MMTAEDRVLVVGAKYALKDYELFSAYICQPHRYFRPFSHVAFYYNKAIYQVVPAIQGSPVDDVTLTLSAIQSNEHINEEQRRRLIEIVTIMNSEDASSLGRLNKKSKIIFLSGPQSPDTLILPNPIKNDKVSSHHPHKEIPFLQRQRYVSISSLLNSKYTSELKRDQGWKYIDKRIKSRPKINESYS
jgi:hypothetical protein